MTEKSSVTNNRDIFFMPFCIKNPQKIINFADRVGKKPQMIDLQPLWVRKSTYKDTKNNETNNSFTRHINASFAFGG
ncbi:MAG: hypothetical protein IIW26_00110, partial [Tidjanibacter sp.]|nr:hypothetical protein [Tidjanibacter sp.]